VERHFRQRRRPVPQTWRRDIARTSNFRQVSVFLYTFIPSNLSFRYYRCQAPGVASKSRLGSSSEGVTSFGGYIETGGPEDRTLHRS